jgi:hypothetical protein
MTDLATAETEPADHRQQDLYWNELFQLKVQCEYIRRYRSFLSGWVTRFAILRAVASSGSIGGWVIWRDAAFVWGSIIALSQVSDALKDAIPFTARNKAATALLMDLDALFIEAFFEWEGVYAGLYTNEEIKERRRKLMELRHETEWKHFPTADLPNKPAYLTLAEKDVIDYLENMYREGPRHG